MTGAVGSYGGVSRFFYLRRSRSFPPSRVAAIGGRGEVFWASVIAELSPEKAGAAVFHHFYIFLILFTAPVDNASILDA